MCHWSPCLGAEPVIALNGIVKSMVQQFFPVVAISQILPQLTSQKYDNKKKKEKHIVGTKELIFDIVSVVLIICLGVYFGYRSILYYTKETNKKKVEANTLASAIINNNKITTEDNGFRKSEDGYYFSGLVENNYVKVFNRLYLSLIHI